MTIKERAKHFAYEEEGRFIMRDWTLDWEVAENGYATGATEQQEIDIQRAVVWLESRCKMDEELYSINLDEFEQAMKGE